MAVVPVIQRSTCKQERVYGSEKISLGMFCAGRLEVGKHDFLPVMLDTNSKSKCHQANFYSEDLFQQLITQGGADTCQGDSGGPAVSLLHLTKFHETRATLVGLTSWGCVTSSAIVGAYFSHLIVKPNPSSQVRLWKGKQARSVYSSQSLRRLDLSENTWRHLKWLKACIMYHATATAVYHVSCHSNSCVSCILSMSSCK